MEKENSVYYKSANYAVLIILVAFLLNIFVAASLKQADPEVARYVSLFIGLLFFSAMPAGVIALIGIRKLGASKLLWKGLVGIFLPLVLTVIAITSFNKVKEMSLLKVRNNIVRSISQGTPYMVDDVIRLDGVSSADGLKIFLNFSLPNFSSDEIDVEVWENDVVPEIRKNFYESEYSSSLGNGIVFMYRYSANDGVEFSRLEFAIEQK